MNKGHFWLQYDDDTKDGIGTECVLVGQNESWQLEAPGRWIWLKVRRDFPTKGHVPKRNGLPCDVVSVLLQEVFKQKIIQGLFRSVALKLQQLGIIRRRCQIRLRGPVSWVVSGVEPSSQGTLPLVCGGTLCRGRLYWCIVYDGDRWPWFSNSESAWR